MEKLIRIASCMLLIAGAGMVSVAQAAVSIEITYSVGMQPLIDVSVGGQWLKLVFDASSGNTAVFVKDMHACVPRNFTPCYSFNQSMEKGTATICEENTKIDCDPGQGSKYLCNVPLEVHNLTDVTARKDLLVIDGLEYKQDGVEGTDKVSLRLDGDAKKTITWPGMPVRLLVGPMLATATAKGKKPPLPLFEETNGLFGASGPSLSCRNDSVWGAFLQKQKVKLIIFDLHPPSQASLTSRRGQQRSRILFDEIDPSFEGHLVWSQPKQTGDVLNDGMYEMLLYHPKVCGIDLLYNTSSNWLAVIDTSGPCLTMPSFLFDRFRSRVNLKCPFKEGEASLGRLCSPDRGTGSEKKKLPSLSFQMEDTQEPVPPRIDFPLERLVFTQKGQELLCVARAENDAARNTADMMFAHIAFGSFAVASFYTIVNLENKTIGLAPRGDAASEASQDMCIPSVQCVSSMQTYYPPRNVCEDPPCSEYIFMRLDEKTKMCVWSTIVPICFGLLLAALAILDLVSHRLYKQAIDKASEFCQ